MHVYRDPRYNEVKDIISPKRAKQLTSRPSNRLKWIVAGILLMGAAGAWFAGRYVHFIRTDYTLLVALKEKPQKEDTYFDARGKGLNELVEKPHILKIVQGEEKVLYSMDLSSKEKEAEKETTETIIKKRKDKNFQMADAASKK